MRTYEWEVQRRVHGLWVHEQDKDPRGAMASHLGPEEFARVLSGYVGPDGDWRLAVWDSPGVGRAPVAALVRRSCATCDAPTIVAREIDGAVRMVDPDPVDGGELALVGDLNEEPTALWGVTIAAGAPRYRLHCCEAG